MGNKSSAPAAPDYSGIAAASEKSADYAYSMGQQQLGWAKEQYNSDRAVTDRVVNSALDRQQTNDQNALKDRSRYEQIYQPLEDQAVQDANSYSSPGRQEYEMGRASSEVAQKMEGARQAAQRNLEGYGIDPSATRFAALDLGSRVEGAAAQAGAANQARVQTEAQGRQMRDAAINTGKGYPAQVAGSDATALMSGNQAANTGLATTMSGARTMGTAPQWQQSGNSALGVWGDTLHQGYSDQMAQYNANQQSSSGIGSILGGAAGLISMFDDGGDVGSTPPASGIPSGVPSGVPVAGRALPAGMSPSGGVQTDDIPAQVAQTGQPARLNAHEFIVPADVARWKGEEFFQKMIEQSRKAKQGATAKPQFKGIPAGAMQRPAPASAGIPA